MSICLSVLSVCLDLSVCLFCLPVCLSVFSVCLSVCRSVGLSVSPLSPLFVSFFLSLYLSVCLSLAQSRSRQHSAHVHNSTACAAQLTQQYSTVACRTTVTYITTCTHMHAQHSPCICIYVQHSTCIRTCTAWLMHMHVQHSTRTCTSTEVYVHHDQQAGRTANSNHDQQRSRTGPQQQSSTAAE